MENIIETKNLSFSYSRKKVLDCINLEVPDRSIYCFLGPNGAGKTTTIKLFLTLLRQNGNSIQLFNRSLKKNRKTILNKVGAVIENPSLYGHLSGKENLMICSRILGIDKKRVDQVMEITQITYAAKLPVRKYSLGMKQRLEIARALLNNPQLLILDEPTNGLDPKGIKEMRELIIQLNRELGKTIFISSHLLDEVQKMATHVGIINYGKLQFQGSLHELNAFEKKKVNIQTSNNELAEKLICELQFNVIQNNGSLQMRYESKTDIAFINRLLVKNEIHVYEIEQQQTQLEETFFSITNY